MDKRNKFWRRQQMARVFKVRMIFYASCGNGQKFIKLQVFHVVVGCVEGRSTIVGNIRKRCCVLLKNH